MLFCHLSSHNLIKIRIIFHFPDKVGHIWILMFVFGYESHYQHYVYLHGPLDWSYWYCYCKNTN